MAFDLVPHSMLEVKLATIPFVITYTSMFVTQLMCTVGHSPEARGAWRCTMLVGAPIGHMPPLALFYWMQHMLLVCGANPVDGAEGDISMALPSTGL